MRVSTTWVSLSMLALMAGCSAVEDREPDSSESSDALSASEDAVSPLLKPAVNGSGIAASFHTSGTIDENNPFFATNLGQNGRSCATCHDARAAWTMTPALAWRLFFETGGTHPLFRPVDETVRPDADVSTFTKRLAAYSMLLTKGVTRFSRTIKAEAEFEAVAVDDPYGWSTPAAFSNFRRILPTVNEAHQSSVTWTGGPADVRTNLVNVFVGGTRFHGEGTVPPTPEQAGAAADFLMGLSFAQVVDFGAGRLDARGARGGPVQLAAQPFYLGINALGGDAVTGAPFDNESFDIYEAWEQSRVRRRAQIARGEAMFYESTFAIGGVPGLNDALGQETIEGHCTTCHNAPNVGTHSEFRVMDLGLTGPERRTRDVPLVTLRNKATGETRETTDLGRALATGKWADLGKFKVPTLRGVGSRAPYFHDGSAANLHEVLRFYRTRFGADFQGREEDLIAFLEAL